MKRTGRAAARPVPLHERLVAAVATIFSPIPAIFRAIAAVFGAVPAVFGGVGNILENVTNAGERAGVTDVLGTVGPILCAIPTILGAVAAIFATIPTILGTVTRPGKNRRGKACGKNKSECG